MINSFWTVFANAEAHCLICGTELKTDCLNYFLDMIFHYNKFHPEYNMGVVYKPIYLYNTSKMSDNNNNNQEQEQEKEVTKEKTTETETVKEESENS